MNKALPFLILCLLSQLCLAQSLDDIKTHFNKLENGKTSTISKKEMMSYYQKHETIIVLEAYLQSEQEQIQREAVRLCSAIGSNNKHASNRKIAVNNLLRTAATASTSLVGQIAKGLQKFKQSDFNIEATQQLTQLIKTERPHLTKWIELAGFLQLKPLLDEIKYTHQADKILRKSIGLALTRCGDESKKENLMKNIASLKIDDGFVYGVLPLLVYTRQKETTDYLFDIILSDQKNCTPAGPDIKGNIKCGYRVMEALAPYVKDIPLEIATTGDLKTNDYKKTLKETRAWIVENRSNYELVTDIF